MNPDLEYGPITTQDESMISFQEGILESIKKAIETEKRTRASKQEDIRKRFIELRDETKGLISQSGEQDTDLPMLYEQMHYQLSLAARKLPSIPSVKAPYFAHLVVQENSQEKHYLLGYSAFISNHSQFVIVDWRNAPIAKLFFEYQIGEEYEVKLPGRKAQGIIAQRNILVIREGMLLEIQAHEESLRRVAGAWKKVANKLNSKFQGGQGKALRGTAFKTLAVNTYSPEIAALLDKTQYKILSENPFKPLLILGGAGSGKTTVALHRLASLCYLYPENFQQKNCLILVPEIGLVHLCRNLLINLGLSQIPVDTFDGWIDSLKKRFLKKLPKKYCQDSPAEVIRCKRHPRIFRALDAYIRKKMQVDKTWLKRETSLADFHEFFTDRVCLSELVDENDNSITAAHIEKCIRHSSQQMDTPSDELFKSYDKERIKAIDGKSLDWATPDDKRGTMDIEDVPILLELKHRKMLLGSKSSFQMEKCAHLVLDEAQEFSLIELAVIGKAIATKQSVSIAGDGGQHISDKGSFSGWASSLNQLGLQQTQQTELQVNYRCPQAISSLAGEVLAPLGIRLPESKKPGVPVRYDVFHEQAIAYIQMIESLIGLFLRENNSTVAIITRYEEMATEIFESFRNSLPCRLVLDGKFSFQAGIDICSVNQVKGLEFDYVLLPDANYNIYKNDATSRRAFYVAISRTIHQLWVCAIGQASELIKPYLNEN